MVMIEVDQLRKSFSSSGRDVSALRGISFSVEEGTFFTLLGPSGCGKTTTLRSLAGLERPSTGKIVIGDKTVFAAAPPVFVPPERRAIGMVFQSYAIWPHMTVFDNVAYPLRTHHLSKAEVRKRVLQVLDTVGLGDLADRLAPNLSGGQQQRVALARALVGEPEVLLLDEPLSNLDTQLREQMRVELRRLQKQIGITAVYVTHDQVEAMSLSDQIAVILNGEIMEVGSPRDIYVSPHRRFTAEFLGIANVISGRVAHSGDGKAAVETPAGVFLCGKSTAAAGENVDIFFRPENATLRRGQSASSGEVQVVVENVVFLGEIIDCWLRAGDVPIRVRVHPKFAPQPGERLYLVVAPEDCRIVV